MSTLLPFLHHRVLVLDKLLAQASAVLVKYNALDLDLAPALDAFLDSAIGIYHDLGQSRTENELLVLKAQFVSAQNGTHPLTLEHVPTHRRAMLRAIALMVLQQCTQKVRADVHQDAQQLEDGRTQLQPFVLLAFQKGVIQATDDLSDQNQLEAIWQRLLLEPEIKLAARRVVMQFNLSDIYLVLSDLITAARQADVVAVSAPFAPDPSPIFAASALDGDVVLPTSATKTV